MFTRAPQEKGQRGGGGTEGLCFGDSTDAAMMRPTFPLTRITISCLWSNIYIMLVLIFTGAWEEFRSLGFP